MMSEQTITGRIYIKGEVAAGNRDYSLTSGSILSQPIG